MVGGAGGGAAADVGTGGAATGAGAVELDDGAAAMGAVPGAVLRPSMNMAAASAPAAASTRASIRYISWREYDVPTAACDLARWLSQATQECVNSGWVFGCTQQSMTDGKIL